MLLLFVCCLLFCFGLFLSFVVDEIGSSGHLMNDGCAALPLWAMQQIASAASIAGLPSAVQGRIGPCKVSLHCIVLFIILFSLFVCRVCGIWIRVLSLHSDVPRR
jgi:hypothetical protein